jgi:hypothetical protein
MGRQRFVNRPTGEPGFCKFLKIDLYGCYSKQRRDLSALAVLPTGRISKVDRWPMDETDGFSRACGMHVQE